MIEKKYLFNNKDAESFCKVVVEAESDRLSVLYDSLDSQLDPEIKDDVHIVENSFISSGLYELTLDVEDVDFSEFED